MKVGIIGAGLMGGSIYKGCEGAVLFGDDWVERIGEVDLLILAVPVSAILEIGEKIAKTPISKPLVVVDIGSVKSDIAKQFASWTRDGLEFVATHPMAGKEKSGFEHSDPAIFQGAAWVVTPHPKNAEATLQRVEEWIRKLGAEPMRMDAAEHDKRAALISQLPYLISKTLKDFVDPESLAMSGPGFKSMIRLANDNREMRKEIARYNKKNIVHFLNGYIDALKSAL